MLDKNIPDGASLFFGGAIAVFLSWIASGCRLGSFVDPAPIPLNPDQISGYYVVLPQKLKLYATTAQTTQQTGAISLIPQEVAQFMTNPVALILEDLPSGAAALTTPKGKHALPVYVNTDNTLTYHGTTPNRTYWLDPECQSYLEIAESGKVIKTTSVTAPLGNELPLTGKLELKIQVITQFEGNCLPTFSSIAKCYQDVTQCAGKDSTENETLQATVIELLNPWIQSKAILPADIPNLVNYAYEVSYQ